MNPEQEQNSEPQNQALELQQLTKQLNEMQSLLAAQKEEFEAERERQRKAFDKQDAKLRKIENPGESEIRKLLLTTLPRFTGGPEEDPGAIEDLIYRIEDCMHRINIPESSLVGIAGCLFSEGAGEFYRSTIRNSNVTWDVLKQVLLERYLPPDFDWLQLVHLVDIRQGTNETIQSYSGRFSRLSGQARVFDDRLLTALFLRGTLPHIRREVNRLRDNHKTLLACVSACQSEEKENRRRTNYSESSPQVMHVEASSRKRKRMSPCKICDGDHQHAKCPTVQEMIRERIKTRSNYSDHNETRVVSVILDSACTQHMIPEDYGLVHTTKVHTLIVTACGKALSAITQGELHAHVGPLHVRLRRVLHVPGLVQALLSVRALSCDGFSVEFSPTGECKVTRGDETFTCSLVNNQYTCDLTVPTTQTAYLASTTAYDLWHERLGHPGTTKL